MADMHEDRQTLRITALPVADLARILAAAYGRRVTEEQVRDVIEAGGLLRPDGTVSLIEYVAFLVREVSHAGSD
jgi:hypothetical protein